MQDNTTTPVVNTNDTLSSANLNPQDAIVIPKIPPATKVDGMLGEFEQSSSDFTKQLEAIAKESEAKASGVFDDYINQALNAPTRTEIQIEEEKKVGLNDVQTQLKDINQQILQEQRSLTNRVREIEKNREGLFGGALQDEVNRAKSESFARQADLSVIQMGIQGKYDSAKAIADRATNALFERREQQLAVYEKVYTENKELFNKKEQRAFESAQEDRKNKLEAEKEERKTISDLSINALQNGAPASVVIAMRNAKTVNDAIKAGGVYVDAQSRVIKDLQIENLKLDNEKIRRESVSGVSKLTGAQWLARGYGERTLEAGKTIDEIGDQFTSSGSLVGSLLPNIWKSGERQKFEQAQRNFINAVLRRESGAAIADSEFDSARLQYFPQPGDNFGVLAQKKVNRASATKNLLLEGGYTDTQLQDAIISDPLSVGADKSNPLGI